MLKNPPAMQELQETWVRSLGLEDPLEEEMETHSSILARESQGQRSLLGGGGAVATVHGASKGQT